MTIVGQVAGVTNALSWNKIVWPPSESNLPVSWHTPQASEGIPGVGRALSLITGLVSQMPLDVYKGADQLPRPAVLAAPDPDRELPWWLSCQVHDYLVHGNVIEYVTSRNAAGFPVSVMWVPASWVSIVEVDGVPGYWVGGVELNRADVIHVQRGADPTCVWRGVGVIEQHLGLMRKAQSQERYEQSLMHTAAVPSVAVIAPNPDLSQDEANAAQEKFIEKYGGDERKPAVFPHGTSITPLSWSPADQELDAARKMTLVDLANAFNLDGYWLGAPAGSMTYRTPGPMYLHLMRQTIGPILALFEAAWTRHMVPHGQRVKFDRQAVFGDDMETTISYLGAAVTQGILTVNEAREYLGKPPLPEPEPAPVHREEPSDEPE